MPVFDTYAARERRAERAGQPDVYTYDFLPLFLRVQLGMIFKACLGEDRYGRETDYWEQIVSISEREIESFHAHRQSSNFRRHGTVHFLAVCIKYLHSAQDVRDLLSFIEICCLVLQIRSKAVNSFSERQVRGITQDAADGLEEVNARFQIAGVGYQFTAGEIVRVDSQYVHAEVVKPTLELLAAPEFAKANDEFRTAHEHYRSGRLRDCNTAALRCMESVLKTICDGREWAYERGATVERLVAVVRSSGLFPDYLGGYFDNLIGAMKAGAPKVRDRDGGHGAAPGDAPIPEHISGFALHSAAASIVMLVQAYRSLATGEV
jgi:hypothetical protein